MKHQPSNSSRTVNITLCCTVFGSMLYWLITAMFTFYLFVNIFTFLGLFCVNHWQEHTVPFLPHLNPCLFLCLFVSPLPHNLQLSVRFPLSFTFQQICPGLEVLTVDCNNVPTLYSSYLKKNICVIMSRSVWNNEIWNAVVKHLPQINQELLIYLCAGTLKIFYVWYSHLLVIFCNYITIPKQLLKNKKECEFRGSWMTWL